MCNYKSLLIILVYYASFCGFSFKAEAQFDSLKRKIEDKNKINILLGRQKIFVHHDRPVYTVDDTLWLKGYILNSEKNYFPDSAGIVYMEIINNKNDILIRKSTYCEMGKFGGEFILSRSDFAQGDYTLRAYTSWMRNFGDSLFFESHFKIIDPLLWHISLQQYSIKDNTISLLANISSIVGKLIEKNLFFSISDGGKILSKGTVQIDKSGTIFIQNKLNNNPTSDKLLLTISDNNAGTVTLPLKTENLPTIDAQFLPESGHLIVGKEQRLGIKAVGINGKGIDITGFIKDQEGRVISQFTTTHKGMGIVTLIPKAGQHYTACFNNDSVKLSDPEVSGSMLRVINNPLENSLQIIVDATPDLETKSFYFTLSKDGVCFIDKLVQLKGLPFVFYIDKKRLPSGVFLCTLYNSIMMPVNERAIFVRNDDNLNLTVKMDKPSYKNKDSVGVELSVRNAFGNVLAGSFSVAVIDTSQVSINKYSENLLTCMLLSSDLKSEIEEPYYYFDAPDSNAIEALMLTQGWVKYEWDMKSFKYPWENEFELDGRVEKGFGNKSSKNTRVILLGHIGKLESFVRDTITNNNGAFRFGHFPFFESDSVSITLQAFNNNNKAFNVGITLNTNHFPPYHGSNELSLYNTLPYDTTDIKAKSIFNYIRKQKSFDKNYLEEVFVVAKQKVPGSENLNGSGIYDQLISEKALQKTPNLSLWDVLLDSVHGLRLDAAMDKYKIKENNVKFIIDGINLDFFDRHIDFIKSQLQSFDATDIRGIEVMNSLDYTRKYAQKYLSNDEFPHALKCDPCYSFIEITTKSKSGPMTRKTPGLYTFMPLVPVLPKKFYNPRYNSIDDKTLFLDLRSTVYWNPDVLINKNGEAGFSFYTSENNSNYIMIIQGTNFSGQFGVIYVPVLIKN